MDKKKFREILTIIDSNKFGQKNKIGVFKYIDIKDLNNSIKDNTISEIEAKQNKKFRNKTFIYLDKKNYYIYLIICQI